MALVLKMATAIFFSIKVMVNINDKPIIMALYQVIYGLAPSGFVLGSVYTLQSLWPFRVYTLPRTNPSDAKTVYHLQKAMIFAVCQVM